MEREQLNDNNEILARMQVTHGIYCEASFL